MERLEQLETIIKDASEKYYSNGTSSLTDTEFDELIDELRSLDPDNELLDSTGYGYEPVSGSKIKLIQKMSGISNQYRLRTDFDTYELSNSQVYITPKLDGLAAQLYYKNGKLVYASTRGNGTYGVDITNKLVNIPKSINSSEDLVVTGELVMTKTYFLANWNESTHPRNVVAGLVGSDNPDQSHLSKIDFVAYGLSYPDSDKLNSDHEYYVSSLSKLSDLGFSTVDLLLVPNKLVTWDFVDFYSVWRDYYCDGIVVRSTDKKVIKIKRDSLSVQTTVTSIEWNMSTRGNYIPLVYIEPKWIGGAVIKKISGVSLLYLSRRGIGVGSEVGVIRSGEVIPYIKDVIKSSTNFNTPCKCKYCNHDLVHGEHLHCNNPDCSGVGGKALFSYVWRLCWELNFVGNSLIGRYIELMNATNIEDLYINELPKLSDSITDTRIKEIHEKVREPKTPDMIIYALTINGLGWIYATKLVECTNLYEVLTSGVDLVITKPISQGVIFNRFLDSLPLAKMVAKYTGLIKLTRTSNTDKIKVEVTGKMSLSRSQFLDKVKDKVEHTSIKSADYLVCNEPSSSSKYKYAINNNVKIITEDELYKMIGVE